MTDILPWHSNDLERLSARAYSGSLSHALLIESRELRSAEAFAQAACRTLICQRRVAGGCGECRGCELIQAETHPDRFAVKHENETQIRVDTIRDLIEWSQKTAQIGGVKVAIIEGCERMNRNAQNALLKVLEEPTSDTYLVLVTADPQRLLATVRSRCERMRLTCPSQQEALDWVNRQLSEDQIALSDQALAFAQGEPLAAIEVISSGLVHRLSDFETAFGAWCKSEISSLELGRTALDLAEPVEIYTLITCRLRESVRSDLAKVTHTASPSIIVSLLQRTSSWQQRLEALSIMQQAWAQSKTVTGLNQSLHLEAALMNLEAVLA